MSDRITIFDDIFALSNRLNGKLVTTADILFQDNLLAINLHYLARFQVVGKSYGNIIYCVNF